MRSAGRHFFAVLALRHGVALRCWPDEMVLREQFKQEGRAWPDARPGAEQSGLSFLTCCNPELPQAACWDKTFTWEICCRVPPPLFIDRQEESASSYSASPCFYAYGRSPGVRFRLTAAANLAMALPGWCTHARWPVPSGNLASDSTESSSEASLARWVPVHVSGCGGRSGRFRRSLLLVPRRTPVHGTVTAPAL